VVFLNGELITHGATREIFTRENIARTYQMHIFSGPPHEHAHHEHHHP